MAATFGKVDRSKRRLKVMLTGAAKSGKTFAALSFPRPALIDSEGGWELFEQFTPEGVQQTKDIDDALELIRLARADDGKSYSSLVVDSVTVLYDMEIAKLRRLKGTQFGMSDRALVNDRMKEFYNALTQMPIHICLITREVEKLEVVGKQINKLGPGIDADRGAAYPVDFVIRMDSSYKGTVTYARGDVLKKGFVFERVTFDAIQAAINGDLRVEAAAKQFMLAWRGKGLSDAEILSAMRVDKLSQWGDGRAAADAAVEAFIARGKKHEAGE